MKTPSETDLVRRARELVHRMHDVERWAYAVDASVPAETRTGAIREAGYVLAEEDAAARCARYEARGEGGSVDELVVLERADLGVCLLQARGPGTVDRLGPVLERTGFLPQSGLLRRAYDVGSTDAPKALLILAHMVVRWDEDWADLFLLHLASPDPVARHGAALSTVVAAHVARETEPARTLLAEAAQRETYPKLKETLNEALLAVGSIPGSPESPPAP
jgi:hypothetical protein